MSSRGVHFAITASVTRRLRAADDDEELLEIVGEIEERWDKPNLFETDKAWDALMRCFGDGTLDVPDASPLELAFFAGDLLTEGDDSYVILITPSQVARAAAALARVTEAWLRERYDTLAFPGYAGKSDADFAYTWSSFQGMPEFFAAAATAKRYVIFTVDQ
jgi:hypothetical protein